MIYAVFESILKRVVTDTMVDNLDEFCTYKYREEHSACTYDYKVVCVDDRFRKPEPKKLRWKFDMSKEYERNFRKSNRYHIYEKYIEIYEKCWNIWNMWKIYWKIY